MAGIRKPNIIIFNPDQWRGDVLGHMGNAAAVTPTLDEMVEIHDGLVSTRARASDNASYAPAG